MLHLVSQRVKLNQNYLRLRKSSGKSITKRYFATATKKSEKVERSSVNSNPVAKNVRANKAFPSQSNVQDNSNRVSKRGVDREKLLLKVGDELHGYKVTEITPVPERNLTAYKLTHIKTGAQHLHLDCEDTNNAFCVSFKTIPRDSTGVAHILEHTTLCGSKKYPVRDPFFNMIKRSLNTYMNAWTAPDYTSYPFSTQNEKDYTNLLSVYLDATFFPNLEKFDFLQEGHRLEFDKKEDGELSLKYKGVVYNEMKGSMSDPSNYFSHRLAEKVYPNSTYSNNSGGEPRDIPNLTYEQLINFHKIHYHPSNSLFITYGDLPLEQHLKAINENALSQFEKIDPNTIVPFIERYTTPQRVEMFGPPQPMAPDPERQTKINVAVLANTVTDPYESFYNSMLSTLLFNGPNSPMHQSLIDSNIGQSYSPSTGYEAVGREAFFGVGLQGIHKKDIKKVEDTIYNTLKQTAEEGFDPKRIESLIHQIEISHKNVTTNFGMEIVGGIMHQWHHGADPVPLLRVNTYVEKLREELSKGPFFQNKIKEIFLNNPHKVTFVMHPDFDYMQKESQRENNELTKLQSQLTQTQQQEIIENANELKRRQELTQDVNVLPTIKLSDIPRQAIKTELTNSLIRDIPITWCQQPTNGIVYFRTLLSLQNLPMDLLIYLPLFKQALTHMGTANRNHRELAYAMELYTGGISVRNALVESPHNLDDLTGYLYFNGYSLERNIEPLFDILREIITSPNFADVETLRTIISQRAASAQDSVISSGDSYAASWAAAPFRRSTFINEVFRGFTQVQFIQNLAMKEDLTEVVAKLRELGKLLLDTKPVKCMVTAEERNFDKLHKQVDNFLGNLSQKPATSNISEIEPTIKNMAKDFFVVPGQVNYISKTFATVPYTHPDSPKLQILGRLVGRGYLHREIREKGGAYGSGAVANGGLWNFFSYRDPHVTRTLDVFKGVPEWIQSNQFSDQDIEEAKLTVFAELDSPVAPSSKGTVEFLHKITHEMRQKRRDAFFETTRKDLLEVASRYLIEERSSIAVVGSAEGSETIKSDSTWKIQGEQEITA